MAALLFVAVRLRLLLLAVRVVRGGSLCRFVANRGSPVALGGRAAGVCGLCIAMRNKDRTPPSQAADVLPSARIAPKHPRADEERPRRRRRPGRSPSLPWPRTATNARGQRPRPQHHARAAGAAAASRGRGRSVTRAQHHARAAGRGRNVTRPQPARCARG